MEGGTAITQLEIHLLGEIKLSYKGRELGFGGAPRLQAFLAYLLLHRGLEIARASVAYTLWPNSREAQARTNLRRLIHQLRVLLPESERFVRLDGQTLLWYQAGPYTLDTAEFEAQLERAEGVREPKARQKALEGAVNLYRGDLLPGLYEDWLEGERERLRGRFGGALEGLATLLAQSDPRAALPYAQRLMHHDPLAESGYRLLMELYSRSGARVKALHIYHQCVSLLQRELGTEPEEGTRVLYERLLQGSPSRAPVLVLATTPFVGRRWELGRLRQVWQETAGPQLILVGGDAGIGKTRLVETFVGEVVNETTRETSGVTVASACCYTAEGRVAYAPVTDLLRAPSVKPTFASLDEVWLAELTRLLPELRREQPQLAPPSPLQESWQRLRFFEALARTFLQRQPLLLVLDDLQGCDRESLEWLHYLLRFEPSAKLLVVGTFRSDEVTGEVAGKAQTAHPLVFLRDALEREGRLTALELGALSEQETVKLAQALGGEGSTRGALEPSYSDIYRETEGVPLFIVEMVRSRSLARGEDNWEDKRQDKRVSVEAASTLPPRLQAVIGARLARLSPTAGALAGAAAVIGRNFGIALLEEVSGVGGAALVNGLDELWGRRIVREGGEHSYDFSHDKLREVAYTGLTPARRRRLHRRVGEALAARHQSDPASESASIARHFDLAGEAARALPHYHEAAKAAGALYANDEALTLYGRALGLFKTLIADEVGRHRERAAHLYEGMADIYKLRKEHESARSHYAEALDYTAATEARQRARLGRKFGTTYIAQYRYAEALTCYDSAEAALGEVPEGAPAAWWQEWTEIQVCRARTFYWLGEWREMERLGKLLEPVVRQHGTPSQRGRYFQNLAGMALRRDRYRVSEETLGHARAAYRALEQTGELSERAVMRFNLGFCLFFKRDFQEAAAHIGGALELAERTGDRTLQVRALTYLSLTRRTLAEIEETWLLTLRVQKEAEVAQMTEYIGVAHANFAWLAWLEGHLTEAEQHAKAALSLWDEHPAFVWRWTALFPLIALTLQQRRLEEALGYAKKLLAPELQRLPDALTGALEAAVAAGTAGEAETSRKRLTEALELARQTHFL